MIKENLSYKDTKDVITLFKNGKYGTYERTLKGVKKYLGKSKSKLIDETYLETTINRLITDGYIEKDGEGGYRLTENGIILQKKLRTFIGIIEFRLRDKKLTITFIISIISLILSLIAVLK